MAKTLAEGRKKGSGRKPYKTPTKQPLRLNKVSLIMPELVLYCDSHFGEQLKRERIRMGLSQLQLAELIGSHSSNVAHFEMGDNTFGSGSIQTVFKYAKALGYSRVTFKI